LADVYYDSAISHYPYNPTEKPMTALPPKPTHNFFPLRFSPPLAVSESERRNMIEMAAYLRAEKRNFEAGHAVEDWADAEAEVDLRLSHARRLSGITW
jgi:hypothetical protein